MINLSPIAKSGTGWKLLEERLITTATPTIVFNGIQGEKLKAIKIVYYNAVITSATIAQPVLTCNGDTGANYNHDAFDLTQTGLNVVATANANYFIYNTGQGATASESEKTIGEIIINTQASASGHHIYALSNTNGSGAGDIHYYCGSYTGTDAIESVELKMSFVGNYGQNSKYQLYGMGL